jgi:hypothetical protein
MTSWKITIEVGPVETDDGFVDFLLGEIGYAIDNIDNTEITGIPVQTKVEVSP